MLLISKRLFSSSFIDARQQQNVVYDCDIRLVPNRVALPSRRSRIHTPPHMPTPGPRVHVSLRACPRVYVKLMRLQLALLHEIHKFVPKFSLPAVASHYWPRPRALIADARCLLRCPLHHPDDRPSRWFWISTKP